MDGTTPTTQGFDLRTADPATTAAGTATAATTTTTTTPTPPTPPAAQGDDNLFSKFDIPQTVREKYSDIIPLVLQTESMNDDERQYWFQILPIMTDDQVLKLREILANEKKQLTEIDKQYNQEVKSINDKHVQEWQEFEIKEKRDQLKAAESSAAQAEQAQQEDLLGQLQNL